jgi:hypothetical protein
MPCRLIKWYRHCEGQLCLIFTFDPSKMSELFLGSSALKMKAWVFAVTLLRNGPRRFFQNFGNSSRAWATSLLMFLVHTDTSTPRQDSSKRVICPLQRPLPTHHTTNTREEHPWCQRDSNQRSQQLKSCSLGSCTANGIFTLIRISEVLSMVLQPKSGIDCLVYRLLDHAQFDKHTLGRTPLNERSTRRIGRYLHNTQQTQENIHALSGIWTFYPSKRGAAVLGLRPHGHRDQHRIIHGSNLN